MRCTCLLLTQSGHQVFLNGPHLNRYDCSVLSLGGGNETTRVHHTLGGAAVKGEKQPDLQVAQMNKFEFVIGFAYRESAWLSVPPSLLARADEVIK